MAPLQNMHFMSQSLKLPAKSCGGSPTVKENLISYSLAYPAANSGLCAHCSVELIYQAPPESGDIEIHIAFPVRHHIGIFLLQACIFQY